LQFALGTFKVHVRNHKPIYFGRMSKMVFTKKVQLIYVLEDLLFRSVDQDLLSRASAALCNPGGRERPKLASIHVTSHETNRQDFAIVHWILLTKTRREFL
jgi:hypothetical protein